MYKNIKRIALAILSFILFAVTMFYAADAAWIMIISLISFLAFILSVQRIFMAIESKADSN